MVSLWFFNLNCSICLLQKFHCFYFGHRLLVTLALALESLHYDNAQIRWYIYSLSVFDCLIDVNVCYDDYASVSSIAETV